MKLRVKITLFVLATSLLTVGLSYTLLQSSAERTLKEKTFSNLTAIRSIKTNQIKEHFLRLKNEVSSLANNPYTVMAAVDLTTYFAKLSYLDRLALQAEKPGTELKDRMVSNSDKLLLGLTDEQQQYSINLRNYNQVLNGYGDTFAGIREKFGFYDVMIANARTGDIVYSIKQESEFASSITEGNHSNNEIQPDDQIHKAFVASVAASDKDFSILVDFDFYRPSNNIPAAFIAAPIYNDKRKVGVLIAQISIEELDRTMTGQNNWSAEGLGSSGETYIVGADFKMRSNSRFFIEDPKKYLSGLEQDNSSKSNIDLIERHHTTILAQNVSTTASKQALRGIVDTEIITDYRGVEVLSSYAPLDLPDVNWAIISEIDAEEVFEPIASLKRHTLIQLFILTALIILLSVIFCRKITQSLAVLLNGIKRLGAGDFSHKISIKGNDEITELARYFNKTSQELSDMTKSVDFHSMQSETLKKKIHKVVQDSQIDTLTGAFNRDKLSEELSKSLNDLMKNSSKQYSLVMFDLDNFKQVNDTYGHDRGDEILITVSDLVLENSKESYVFCRWGGDEFMLLLPGESNICASLFAEQLRVKMTSHKLLKKHKVTGSFGVLELNPDHTVDSAFKTVDSVLYKAKKGGRNCVRTYTETILKSA